MKKNEVFSVANLPEDLTIKDPKEYAKSFLIETEKGLLGTPEGLRKVLSGYPAEDIVKELPVNEVVALLVKLRKKSVNLVDPPEMLW